jgi:hypothetical protein
LYNLIGYDSIKQTTGVNMKTQIEKLVKEIELLSVQSFNENYSAWISNSLTTIELKLKKTLEDLKEAA